MNEFGKSLRKYRNRCNDPDDLDRRLSQERFGELLGRELGVQRGFSGAAVSDWERGKSRIRADDRLVLTCILIVLHKHGGIRNVQEANELLETGNYRSLNLDEIAQVFPERPEPAKAQSQQHSDQSPSLFSLGEIPFISDKELKASLIKAKGGPEPAWPRMFVTFVRYFSDRWTVLHSLKAILWFWIWLFAWWLMAASLHWPFSSHTDAISVMRTYILGTLIIPPLIGLLTSPKNNAFWQQHNLANAPVTHLYTYQGAFIGFHLGYFGAFVIALLRYYFHQQPATWFDLGLMLLSIVMGYMSAKLVPYNLWQAYGRLQLADGWIFFFFVIFGPLWGFLFLEIYPYLLDPSFGAIIILLAITMLIILMAWQYRRKGSTVIPIYWWLIFLGLILICQIIALFLK